MRVFYENKLQEVCNNFHFPRKIQATALIYFKRFYLQWSVMQHNPKYVMLTCIYAACKIEENHVSAEELVWNLILLFMHLTDQLKAYVNDMEETAMSEVDNIMLTDAPLLFPPGQLALAALCRSNQGHGAIDFDRHLDSILSRQKSAHTIYELFERINSIESWVNRYAFPSEKDLKHINRRLKSCWGLGSNDESEKGRRNQSTNQRRVRMKRKIYLRTISCVCPKWARHIIWICCLCHSIV
ncbi:cyclin-H1-1-like isoform X3 [Cucurbita moschata]|uniref:B-like cyclin n=1 Tax=Cucurbita moschata TaxID=3662 RepID=A0A6J1GFQ0_CUCMO|nr:cyclin-H1-1-like isoform X3 [Cucurbita moschata]